MELITFHEYRLWPEPNASTFKHALKSWRQFDYVKTRGYTPKTDTRVGTALHSLAEYLPVDKFEAMFVTMPDFKKSPDNTTTTGRSSTSRTSWVVEQENAFIAENGGAEVMSLADAKRCKRMIHAIQRNELAMELITNSVTEVSLREQLFGVDCKGRLDGVNFDAGTFWDLKSTRNVSPRAFGTIAANLHYLFSMAFYWLLLQQYGTEADSVQFIAVQDAVPLGDGSFNEAADCVVYDIPLIALENEFPEIERLFGEYKTCLANDVWPGIPNGPLHIPNFARAMRDTELV